MEILNYKGYDYTTITEAAKSLNVSPSLVYYYFRKGRLVMICLDKLKLVEIDSLMKLNDYIAFRYAKK